MHILAMCIVYIAYTHIHSPTQTHTTLMHPFIEWHGVRVRPSCKSCVYERAHQNILYAACVRATTQQHHDASPSDAHRRNGAHCRHPLLQLSVLAHNYLGAHERTLFFVHGGQQARADRLARRRRQRQRRRQTTARQCRRARKVRY